MATGRADQGRLTRARAGTDRGVRAPSPSARLTSRQFCSSAAAIIPTIESAATEKKIVAKIWSIICFPSASASNVRYMFHDLPAVNPLLSR
jgi:hypothetical protein